MKNEIKSFEFFRGGNATFTVSNNKGEHFTYKIRRREKNGQVTPFFVSAMTGPDNESSYSYLGLFEPENPMAVRLTKNSKFTGFDKQVQVVQWALRRIKNNLPVPEGYAIQHNGSCCRCGRTLTTPESIERGIGPECIKHFGGAR